MDGYTLITLVRVPEGRLTRCSELSDRIESIHAFGPKAT